MTRSSRGIMRRLFFLVPLASVLFSQMMRGIEQRDMRQRLR